MKEETRISSGKETSTVKDEKGTGGDREEEADENQRNP